MSLPLSKLFPDAESGFFLQILERTESDSFPLHLRFDHDRILATAEGLEAVLRLEKVPEGIRFYARYTARFACRLEIAMRCPQGEQFALIPGCIFGDNNLAGAEPGHYPHLTHALRGTDGCSPRWEFRADRAAMPFSALLGEKFYVAIGIEPYGTCEESGGDSLRNGLASQLGDASEGPSCSALLGYRNSPLTFVNKDIWAPSRAQEVHAGSASGWLFYCRTPSPRTAIHNVTRTMYADLRDCPTAGGLSELSGAKIVTRALLTRCWDPEFQHFTNQRCVDPQKRTLTPYRRVAEIGWSGGCVLATPLLLASRLLNVPEAEEKAVFVANLVADARNPDSGLLWDFCSATEGKKVNGWWAGYLVKDRHCSYTNGNALHHLLRSYQFQAENGKNQATWLDTACFALDTIVRLQRGDGNLGYSYAIDRPEVLDWAGFAGVWFVSALARAHQITGRAEYLDAARRGIEFYWQSVRALECRGTPMDTWKSPDQEGNVGFLRSARALYDVTGEDRYLEMMRDSAHFEYLWRYGYRARPDHPPLQNSDWNSCGGSLASVSNPHIAPFGIQASDDFGLLAERTGDSYHFDRMRDGIEHSLNCLALYPATSGYGEPGIITERFCPSDGLNIETYPDGSPSSIWFSYNAWAAAAILEGLCETTKNKRQ